MDEVMLATMTDHELVGYWNVLQFQQKSFTILIDPEGKRDRHHEIVSRLLTVRGIPHETGKRILTIKSQNDKPL